VVVQLLNVPIERDAGRRAREQLVTDGLLTQEELEIIDPLLRSWAWTYVAALLTSGLGPLDSILLSRVLLHRETKLPSA
jgi:Zn-dependent membrane protease YugP